MSNATPLDAETIKQLLQAEAATTSVRWVAVVAGLAVFLLVLEIVRRRKMREELTPIWLTGAAASLLLASSFDLLVWITNAIGAWTPSSTIFFLGLVFLTIICLTYAVHISTLTNQVKSLAQEVAILRSHAGIPGPDDPAGASSES